MKKLIEKIKKTYTRRKKTEKVSKNTNPNPRIGILLHVPENGGALRKVKPETVSEEAEREGGQELALREWMRSAKDYCRKFLDALHERGLLSYDNLSEYLSSGSIFNDIYFLSASQTPAKASILRAARPRSSTGNIDQELKHLPNIRLVFVFSTLNWDALYKRYRPVPLGTQPAPDSSKITRVHGLPFTMECGQRTLLVIPLVQMDQKVFNNLLRNSYFDYLGEGLDEVVKHL